MENIEGLKKVFKEHLGYDDDEIEEFLKNPRNIDVVKKAGILNNKTIIIEVVKSHGCNSQHKIGDKFYFDGAGNLLTKLSPKRICIYALAPLEKAIFASNELLYAGIDPNEMRFKRTSCFDVGLKCGGWGQIVMEIKVVDRNKLKKGKE
jgi:uncharacterized repeat protein (TIGR04076 family)